MFIITYGNYMYDSLDNIKPFGNRGIDIFSSNGLTQDGKSTPWQQPIPFIEPPTSPFPVDILPLWLRDFVSALATQNQVPPEMPALLSLAVVAVPASMMYRIKVREGWFEPLNLYTMVILESGTRKSATLRELLSPVRDFEQHLVADLKPEFDKARHELEIKKNELEEIKKLYMRSKKSSNTKSTSKSSIELKEDMDNLAQEIANTPETFLPTILADDVTMEKMVSLLAENNGHLSIFSAEATLFGIAAGRYSGVANFDDLLKAHVGDSIKQDRLSRKRVDVPEPRLTLGLAVQPVVMRELSNNPLFRLKGLQARFLYSYPDSPLGMRQINPPAICESVKNSYYSIIRKLLAEAQNNEQGLVLLSLSSEANDLIMEFEKWIEPQLSPYGELSQIHDWASKLPGAIMRISGILHIAEHAANENSVIVGKDTVGRALELVDFLITHARKSFDAMDIRNDNSVACKRILSWIDQRKDRIQFSKHDLHRELQGTFKRSEDLDPALKTLIDHGFIREKEKKKSGRGTHHVFEINPLYDNIDNIDNSARNHLL